MKTRSYRQCVRCVMDTTDLEITFDHRGNCNHCIEFLGKRARYAYQGSESEKALEQICQNIKRDGVGKEFDCVIGVSGGVDSSYLAYIAVERGLRPLAVHMDNGWDSEQ